MKEGDPFDTEAMDDLRSRQRQLVRQLHEAAFRTAARDWPGLVALPERADAALLEGEVRELADQELSDSDELAELVSRLRRAGRTAQTAQLFDSLVWRDPYLREFRERTRQEAQEARVDSIPEGLAPDLYRFVHLLLLADELAGDDYRDPRLGQDSLE